MSEDQKRPQWPQQKPPPCTLPAEQWPQPTQAPRNEVLDRQARIEELTKQLDEANEAVRRADRIAEKLHSKWEEADKTAKRRLMVIRRLDQKLQAGNNKLDAKDQQIENQFQLIQRLEEHISKLKCTIDHLDVELDRCKELPVSQPPKHLLETDSATENAILALSELEDVLQRRGIDNKACLSALAYHFTERAKRRT